MLMNGGKLVQGPAWDGTIPPATSNTLFRMTDFATTSDIKDKGPNAIAVTNTSVTVGSNTLGTYMNFGATGYLTIATSALFNLASLDITVILGDVLFPGGQFGTSIIDARPVNTNGRYITMSTPPVAPLTLDFAYNSVGIGTTPTIENTPFKVDLRLRPSEITVVANGTPIKTMTGSFTYTNQQYKIGRSAFASAGVPNLRAKIYYIDIKSV